MEESLVSIIVPCFNVEKKIQRLLESIINQTYDNIELIFVNDGSTDSTETVIKSYEERIIKRGYTFKYLYQNNKGLGGAVNTGLKYINGEYFCWPDADDYFERNSVEHRVNFLNEHLEYAFVTSNAYVRKINDLYDYYLIKPYDYKFERNQFLPLLLGKSIFCAGCHMMRTSSFQAVNPNMDIYEAKRGQNWQLLLPVLKEFNSFFLSEPLYNYIIYDASMSHISLNPEQQIEFYDEHRVIIYETLKRMNINSFKKKYYYCLFKKKYLYPKIFYIACDNNMKRLAFSSFLKKLLCFSFEYDMFKYLLTTLFFRGEK